MTTLAILLFAAAILAYAAVSRRPAGRWITPAMAFVVVGILVGPAGFSLLHVSIERHELASLAELTLVLVLSPTLPVSTFVSSGGTMGARCGCSGSAYR